MSKTLFSLFVVFALAATPVFAQVTNTIDTSNGSSCVTLTVPMSQGSKDSRTNGQVSDLQQFLQDNDYLNSDPTGYFGQLTKKAVQSFQSANGITPNGLVGPYTRAKIKDIDCNGGTVVVPNVSPTNPTNTSTPGIVNATPIQSSTAVTAVTSGNAATFVSWNIPTTMVAGQQYQISVTMQNTGGTTWKSNVIEPTNFYGFTTWPWNPAPQGITQLWNTLPVTSVATGASVTFAFTVTAPTTPGVYPFQWRMLQQGMSWFDASTPIQQVTVTASQTPPLPPPDVSTYGSTPLTQVDSYPRPQNHVQTMIYLIFNTTNTFSYLAKEMDYVWFDQSSLSVARNDGTFDFSAFSSALNTLHTANPNVKIGVHAGLAGMLAPYHLPHAYLSVSDFLHNTSGQLLQASPVSYVNVSSATTRQTLINAWLNIFAKNPALTGINIDGYHSYAKDGLLQGGCQEGPCNTQNFWFTGITALSSALMQALPAKDITYNGILINETAGSGALNSGFIGSNGGVLAEWPQEMYVSPDYFSQYVTTIDSITAQNKKVFFWVQPQILSISHPNVAYTNDANLQRFFLASYLLIQKNPYTYYGYHPGAIYNAQKGVYFYPEWNFDYGTPTAHYDTLSNGLYTRSYSNGIAVVNPTSASLTFTLPAGQQYRVWSKNDGTLISGAVTIPAKSGLFYFTGAPVAMSAPTASISVNPTTVAKGSGTQLTWSSTNAQYCERSTVTTATLGQYVSGQIATNGTVTTNAIEVSPTPFNLRCLGTNGTWAYATVNVNITSNVPTASISANPTTVAKGSGTQLTWSSTNTQYCERSVVTAATLGQYISGQIATSGTQATNPIEVSPTPFNLRCLGGDGTWAYATVNVNIASNTLVLGANTTCVDLPYNLHRGYESYAVTKLQEFLKSRNFLGEVTGFYGDKTVAAVNEYQTTKNLPVTGMVYDFTRAAIKGETCQ